MNWTPQTQQWQSKRAVLFVHGVGNAQPGDYDNMVNMFKEKVGAEVTNDLAIYFLYYDDVNDWFVQKTQMSETIQKISNMITGKMTSEPSELSEMFSEFAGDVLFPVFNQANRTIIQERYLAQMNQIRLDGNGSGVPFHRQEISIICHSLGCFHTYEALQAMANKREKALLPLTNNMQFKNVIYMASPAQMIRTVCEGIDWAVAATDLGVLEGDKLFIPYELDLATDERYLATQNWVSITGDLDPVGGHLMKKRLNWAYMDVHGQNTKIDSQELVSGYTSLKEILQDLISNGAAPNLSVNNPHSWDAYIERHAGDLKQWLA